MHDPLEVLAFWWDAGPEKWFGGGEAIDAKCEEHCGEAFKAAEAGQLDDWEAVPHSALALILLLDQMPRNMFRDTPRMFATDDKALALADRAIAKRFHLAYALPARRFIYMPFMHAEDIDAQTRCVDLCRADGDDEGHRYALIHMDAIRRFGRFPHRNEILGRKTTAEEAAYMRTGGFGG
ncbi:DUF924 family protein [Tepidamorphus sp. 3E244]|uniref:DUF924 family protein n=1 Tax=Tepidamorphus sp. 3E244 TaxID=3385498 RepID=UPI0038FC296D